MSEVNLYDVISVVAKKYKHEMYASQPRKIIFNVPKGAKTLYQAIEPENFLKKFRKKIEVFEQALPELKTISNAAPVKPKVSFYEGKKNIMALYEDEIFRADEILSIVSMRGLNKMISKKEVSELIHGLKAGNGKIRELLDDSPESREYLEEKNRLDLGETKFLPKQFNFDVDLLIYNDSVAMISAETSMAVVIKDRAISGLQRMLLESLWKISE